MAENNKSDNFMTKLATFIVDKRNLFFLIFAILIIFSAFSRSWVNVENDLTAYLPERKRNTVSTLWRMSSQRSARQR